LEPLVAPLVDFLQFISFRIFFVNPVQAALCWSLYSLALEQLVDPLVDFLQFI
jgi:hypothetical protein